MKNLGLVSVMTVCGVLSAWGATVDATWTGNGGDNRWGNAENWNPKKVPDGNDGSKTDYRVRVNKTCEIEIDADATFKTYWFYPEKGAQVTLTGSGTLDNANWTFVGEGASMIVNGPTVTIYNTVNNGDNTIDGEIHVRSGFLKITKSTLTLAGDARVYVEGGEFGSAANGLVLTNNAELVISGGKVSAYTYKVYGSDVEGEKGGLIRLTGGLLNNTYGTYTYSTYVYPGGRFENLGGTVLWGTTSNFDYSRLSSTSKYGQGPTFSLFLPPVGATLNIPSTIIKDSGALHFSVAGDYDKVGGTIYVTNATEEAMGNVSFVGTPVAVRGGATIYANALNFANGGSATFDLDLARLNLGSGGIRRTSTKSQRLNFLDGIVFGAWGDFETTESSSATLAAFGPVTYDTLDCFDQTTTHSIAMSRIKMDAVTDLKATGGGSVTLAPISFDSEFRTLEVAAGTTLEVTNKVALKAMNLKLGANATLKVDLAKGGCVDAAAVAEFGEGAKIVVTGLPATLAEGTLCPIYSAPAGTTPDLSKIEFADGVLPDGWTLAKTANSVYLTDGKTAPYAATETKFWTGAGEDNRYSTAGNWYNGSIPGNGGFALFYGVYNMEVDVDAALDIREFCAGPEAGPFAFSGSPITFQYPSEGGMKNNNYANVRNDGKFSVVVANSIGTPNVFRFFARDEGSVSMTGGSEETRPLEFGGDIRLAGTWTVNWLLARNKNYTASMGSTMTADRLSRLTVMPGAVLTVTEQETNVNTQCSGALAIAQGGTATIDGIQLLFSSNGTHYVDGILTVNCPLVTPARQTFRGDGTLKLLGGVTASDTGSVRVEGGLTLVPTNWEEAVTLSVKDCVTIAPEANWTFGGAASLDLEDHSTLTLATGGRRITFAKPIVSSGTLALTGSGRFEIGAEGMRLGKVTCADGAKIALADGVGDASDYTDILSVRTPDASIAFAEDLRIKVRYDLTTDETIYSAKPVRGLMLIVR